MRLTKTIRDAIVTSVMAATTFAERKESVKQRTSKLARQLLFARVPTEFTALVNGSPCAWFATTNQVSLNRDRAPMAVFNDSGWCYGGTLVEFGDFARPYDFDHCFTKEQQGEFFSALRLEAEKLAEQIKRTERELRSFLMSVTTTEKLLKRMPELEPHIPKTAASYPLVASTVNLQAYLSQSGFDTTVQS